MRRTFDDTIRKQKELLQAAERGALDILTPGALKPETEESLDFSEAASLGATESSEQRATLFDKPKSDVARRRRPWLPALILLLLGASAVALYMAGVFESKQEPDASPVPDAGSGVAAGPRTPEPIPEDAGVEATAPADPEPPDAGSPQDTTVASANGKKRRTGSLFIRTRPPGARIRLDGRKLKRPSPVRIRGARTGRRVIVAEKEGFLPARKEVVVVAGRTARPRLTLKPKPKKEIVAPPPEPKGEGFLRLDSDPWTQVYLGKRNLGPTPLSRIKLPAGEHRLRLVNQEEGIDRTIRVTITRDELTTRTVRF
jgi:hypothetical protein